MICPPWTLVRRARLCYTWRVRINYGVFCGFWRLNITNALHVCTSPQSPMWEQNPRKYEV
jgi:hypothetical protein